MSDQTVNLPIGLASWGMGLVTSLTSLGATLTTWDRDSIGVSLITCASSKLEKKILYYVLLKSFLDPALLCSQFEQMGNINLGGHLDTLGEGLNR